MHVEHLYSSLVFFVSLGRLKQSQGHAGSDGLHYSGATCRKGYDREGQRMG